MTINLGFSWREKREVLLILSRALCAQLKTPIKYADALKGFNEIRLKVFFLFSVVHWEHAAREFRIISYASFLENVITTATDKIPCKRSSVKKETVTIGACTVLQPASAQLFTNISKAKDYTCCLVKSCDFRWSHGNSRPRGDFWHLLWTNVVFSSGTEETFDKVPSWNVHFWPPSQLRCFFPLSSLNCFWNVGYCLLFAVCMCRMHRSKAILLQ